jgi:2-polyprenyl-6-methoxyphenol hydroxylase-like FAD-dependent oxidoreductase
MDELRVLIVGGGLGGLCLAHALAAQGASVDVFERDAGPDVRGQGYRLTIDETGSDALRACLPRKNYDFIRATASRIGRTGGFVFLDERAREFQRFTFDMTEFERRDLITGQVDRRTLRQALLAGLGDRVRFGHVFSGYREEGRRVVAVFDDGSSDESDVLIGADGTHSRVRRQQRPDSEPRDTGIRAIFGRTYVTAVTLPVLGPLLTDAGIMALGPRGALFFCTSMCFREAPAAAAARLGIEGDSWPARDYFMWAVAVRARMADTPAMKTSDDELHSLALRSVSGFHDDYQALVQQADRNDLVLVPIRAAPPLKPSSPRRVALLGDAAHTMPPFGAHGANTALRDAKMLAQCLALGSSGQSVEGAIGEYDSAMRRYSRPLVRGALRMMKMATADFPLKQTTFRTALRVASMFSR